MPTPVTTTIEGSTVVQIGRIMVVFSATGRYQALGLLNAGDEEHQAAKHRPMFHAAYLADGTELTV